MTKADIINRVSEELGIDRRTVGLVIESFMKCVKDALGRERSVFLRGFGTFSLKKRAAKKAQNIQQHTTICIPVWGIERSGFFNGREKWAKGFENQRV